MQVALISCVGEKHTGTHKAKELYKSSWFIKARRYAESQYYRWHILSAKHFLVDPETEIEYYELYLPKTPLDYRKNWAEKVFGQIKELYLVETELHIFAGEAYRKYLVPLLEEYGYRTNVPLKGLGIGQQLKWFKDKESS